jgi:hypothetical protein
MNWKIPALRIIVLSIATLTGHPHPIKSRQLQSPILIIARQFTEQSLCIDKQVV